MWIILLYLEKGYTCISYKDNQYNKTLKKGMQKMHTNTGHINNLSNYVPRSQSVSRKQWSNIKAVHVTSIS